MEFDALVFIGRFQPFHHGHAKVIDEALQKAKEVIILVGSSGVARSIRNPFTFEERLKMIKDVYPQENVKVIPIRDFPYNETKWVTSVRSAVSASMRWISGPQHIGLIGHSKDKSSYYLKLFPTWTSIEVSNYQKINATDIRNMLFSENHSNIYRYMHASTYEFLTEFSKSEDFSKIFADYLNVKKYKDLWKDAPFPPTFVAVDSVVTIAGHVLLVKRKFSPGKGLWALPGGFLNQDETLFDGAVRELKEETGIKISVDRLKPKTSFTFDDPNRSARGRMITTAFYFDLGYSWELPKVKGSDDAEKAKWVPLNEVKEDEMFDDHYHIIDHFLG